MDSVVQNGWDQLRLPSFLSLFCATVYPEFGYLNLTRLVQHYVASIALSTNHIACATCPLS